MIDEMKKIFYAQGHSVASGNIVLNFIRQVAQGSATRVKFKEYTEMLREKQRNGEDHKYNILIYENTEVFLDMADNEILMEFYNEMK